MPGKKRTRKQSAPLALTEILAREWVRDRLPDADECQAWLGELYDEHGFDAVDEDPAGVLAERGVKEIKGELSPAGIDDTAIRAAVIFARQHIDWEELHDAIADQLEPNADVAWRKLLEEEKVD